MATTVTFVDSTSSSLAIDPSKFFGAKISATGTGGAVASTWYFEKTSGAATGQSNVILSITDHAKGNKQKRAFQAMANALGGHPRHGAVVKIANDITGVYSHKDILGITSINL